MFAELVSIFPPNLCLVEILSKQCILLKTKDRALNMQHRCNLLLTDKLFHILLIIR